LAPELEQIWLTPSARLLAAMGNVCGTASGCSGAPPLAGPVGFKDDDFQLEDVAVSVEAAMMSGSKVFGPRDLPAGCTVRTLKEQVSEAMGAAHLSLRLTLGERTLQDTDTLASLGRSTLSLAVVVQDATAVVKWKEWSQQDCHHTGRDDMPGLGKDKGQISVFDGGSWEFVFVSIKFQRPMEGPAPLDSKALDVGAWKKVTELADHPVFSSITTRLGAVHALIQECDLGVAINTTSSGQWSFVSKKTEVTLSSGGQIMTMLVERMDKMNF